MLTALLSPVLVLAGPSGPARPEFPVCPISGYPYREGEGILLTVRGRRYWACHVTHAEALAKHPDQYLDKDGVPKVLAKPSPGNHAPPVPAGPRNPRKEFP